MPTTAPKERSRLSPEVRRAQIVEAASAFVVEQGHLPLPLDKLAARAGVSKALIYAYFPTQTALCNAILQREFDGLEADGVAAAADRGDLETAALACADLYLEHILRRGPVLHIILRDPVMRGQVTAARVRDRIATRFARLARRELGMPAKDSVATFNLVLTIPEESAQLVRSGEMSRLRARRLCADLTASSVDAFRAAPV